jgi:solute carrier family 25 phosphate transporter 23/24/25/41
MSASVQPKKKTNYGHLVTGGIAGAFSRTATSPLERLRILKQVTTKEYRGLSTIASFKYMWQKEGLVGFFKGNGMTVLKIAPFSAIEFYCYEVYKSKLFPKKEKHEFTYMEKILCGGLTGITA